MELENIVANTVLLKAREGERAAGGSRSIPGTGGPPAPGCGRWGLSAGPGGGCRGPCGGAGAGKGSSERSLASKEKIDFPPLRGGLGKEASEIAEITIFAHLFLPSSRCPPSSLVPQIVLFQRLLLKVSCRCIHSKGLSKSANSFPRCVMRPAGSYRFNVQSLPYSALLGDTMLPQTCPLLRAACPQPAPHGAGAEPRAAGVRRCP